MTSKERGQIEEASNRVNRAFGALAADKDSAWGEAMAELRATKGTLERLLLPKPKIKVVP